MSLEQIAREQKLSVQQVRAVARLLDEGGSVPFIARYRKEATGSLDEVQIAAIRDRRLQLAELEKRREAIRMSLEERELLTPELQKSIAAALTLTELEDVYLPYRPKRRTRGQIAREKGLEPLARTLWRQDRQVDPDCEARKFVSAELGVASVDEALAGARDMIAERINEDAAFRAPLRERFARGALISTHVVKGQEEAGAKFRDYFDWQESAGRAPGHRVLAMFRGENEGMLKLQVRPPQEEMIDSLERRLVANSSDSARQVALAVADAYKRLLAPSLETELRGSLKKQADAEAIGVFAGNLRELLMASPLGRKAVLAIDPGFRTGCKVVCLDAQGKLLHHTVIFPEFSQKRDEAARTVRELCEQYAPQAIAVGNGTAGRETEAFLRELELGSQIAIVMVNESGASIYSASEAAREEFAEYDLTVRGAVSIGRRLMDPLAELVKLDPKSIGVGQYQHDVDQGALKQALDDVVMSCVNAVGVELNSASRQLLAYVSGIGPALAANIVAYREDQGAFKSRADLKKVPRLGAKAFEQCAGFMRICDARNPLDASAVHPESYSVVKQMAADLGCTVADLMSRDELRRRIDLNKYLDGNIGLPTLNDILAELAKPGRDPREQFEAFCFAEGINSIDDLVPGLELPGVVTNVTNFGAFVDVGVHQDGLVHISQLADCYVKNPADVVRVQQRVRVTVLEVDARRRRISLSMRG
jgi:uncharacterized protein